MITLKHLSREFDVDPPKLRRLLRKKFGLSEQRRWKWDEKDETLKKVREWLGSQCGTRPVQKEIQRT